MNILKFFISFRFFVWFIIFLRRPTRIFLYGAGEIGVEIRDYLNHKNIPVYCWLDMKANTIEYEFWGHKVYGTSKLKEVAEADLVVICSEVMIDSMVAECKKQNVFSEKLVYWSND